MLRLHRNSLIVITQVDSSTAVETEAQEFPLVGAYFKDNNTTFRVWAPQREAVQLVIGDDIIPMTAEGFGYWKAVVENVFPGTRYKIKLDADKTFPDPASRSQPDGVHGDSMIVDTNFDWSDAQWKGLPLGDMVIYELHVGTFTPESTFDGVISKIPYLKTLGINAIELMPVAQFPGSRNWGYDGVFPFAVQHSYGGVAGLKRLVNEAHQNDIAIILDVVYNHQGPEGNYLSEFGPYFTDKYKTGWGSAINYDDAYCDGARNFYWQNALMWLDEFHIDGLRLDAVHAIWDNSATHFIESLCAKVRALEKSTGCKKVLIAEFDLNNPRYINPIEKGGYGLDGQWIDEFHHALHSIVTGETDGYYEDFGDISHLSKAIKDSYVYTGQYSVHRKKHFGVTVNGNPFGQFVIFAQNHDQIGNRFLGDRLSSKLSFEALKLTAAAYLLTPHVPMLFMGEEYGETNPFQYFISHTDESLVTAVREGRRKEFSYFNWEGEVPDPQSKETFEQCILSWKLERGSRQIQMLEYYKWLINFRKTRKAFKNKQRNDLMLLPSSTKNIILFELHHDGDRILVAMNFNKDHTLFLQPFSFPLKKIFDTSSSQWGGPAVDFARVADGEEPILMNPESVSIFEF
jgi:maltooligosyltrehalose trehalohydrolase